MNKKIINALKYTSLLGVGILLLWLTFKGQDLQKVYNDIKEANWWWVGLSMLCGFLAFLSRAIRWVMLLEPLGYKPRLLMTSYALMIGYFANLAIPRIGEITRCGILSKTEKIPMNSLIGTVIVERVIDLVLLILSILTVTLLEFDTLKKFLADYVIGPMANDSSGGFNPLKLIALIGVVAVLVISYRLLKKSGKFESLFIKINDLFRGIGEGIKTVMNLKNTGAFIAHTLFIWVMYFVMTYVCFFALKSTAHLGAKEGLFTLVAGGLGMTAPVQGGIGAYHWIVSRGLTLFDIPLDDGVVFATLVHTSQTFLVVVLGLLSMVLLFIANRKKAKNEQAQ
ncbi:MAG: flippase-like domain-containing protein [Bacteroidia bacterium]|nr:flippase-like domain-containing protein [Bacteroidia bacterium]